MRRILVIACALLAAKAATIQNYEPPNNNNQGYTISGSLRSPDLGVSVSSTSPQDQTALNGASFQTTSGFEQSSTSGHHKLKSTAPFSPSESGQINPSFSNEQLTSGNQDQVSFPDNQQPSGNQDQVSVAEQRQNQESSIQQSFESSSFERSEGDCPDGQLRHFDGSCVTPEISRNVFVYTAPERDLRDNLEIADIPKPKIEHNIVFIRTDELQNANDPIIVPPPQRKHVIYVLNQQSEVGGQRIIEVTTPEPRTPEVYFVNYADGETPTLPDGIDFETALNSAVHAEGQVIGGSNNFDGIKRDDFNINDGADANDFGSGDTHSGMEGNVVATPGSVASGDIGSADFGVSTADSNAVPSRSDNEGYNINNPTSIANFQVNNNVAEDSSGATAQGSGASLNTFQASTPPVAPAPQQFYSSP